MKLFDYINQGGVIMYLLVLINIFGIALMLYKFFDLANSLKNLEQTAVYITSKNRDAFSSNNDTPTQAKVEISLRELNSYMSGQEKGLNTIKVIATVSPLLGLLGTVLGVLVSFNKMASSGMGDPSIFASGISLALITTVGGLIVSIPHYIGHNFLISKVDDLEMKLEKEILLKVLK